MSNEIVMKIKNEKKSVLLVLLLRKKNPHFYFLKKKHKDKTNLFSFELLSSSWIFVQNTSH